MRAGLRILALVLGGIMLASCGSDDHPKPRKWNPNGGPARSEDWHSPTAALMGYDANHDGVLTRKELEAGLKADFAAADKEHTGCLNSDEVTAINEERMKYDESAASPLIDFANKGCIDFDEYATMARSLFEELDTDGDGELDQKELHTRRKRPEQRQEPPPTGGGY